MPTTFQVKVPDSVGDVIGISDAGDPPVEYEVKNGEVTVAARDVPKFLRLVEGSSVDRKAWQAYLESQRPKAQIVEVDPTRATAVDLASIAAEVTAPVLVAKTGGSVIFADGTEIAFPEDGTPILVAADKAQALREEYPDAFGFDGDPAPATPDPEPVVDEQPEPATPKRRRKADTTASTSTDAAPAADPTSLDAPAAEGTTTDGDSADGTEKEQ